MKTKYFGVWPTMIGAFDENKQLDLPANRAIADYLIRKGAHGLFALCQSTEMFYFNLDEKVALAKAVVEEARGRVPVIASGHTSDRLEDQIEELKAIAETGVDAVILVSNRLDVDNQGGQTLIDNLKKIFEALPHVEFGVYECPYPYLRLLTDEEICFLAESQRCTFIKDVSCNREIQERRVELAKGSKLHLFNANTETLLTSLQQGYVGYNGVMGNFHIDLYRWLFEHVETHPEECEKLQRELTDKSEIEKYFYPVNAKFHMQRDGVQMGINSRRLEAEKFCEEDQRKVKELEEWEKEIRQRLSEVQ